MSNLIYKEFHLAVHPTVYMFMVIGALLLVPAYPYGMVFFFGCLGFFFTSLDARENHDAFYTATLPIKKRDVVKGKCLVFTIVELGQLIISLPFAVIRLWTVPNGNPVGIEANVAFYGFGLITYAVFNFLFLVELSKSAYQVGKSFVFAIIPATLIITLMELLPHFQATAWIDSLHYDGMIRQIPILIVGVVVYILGMLATYHVASKNFEQVDL